jgi:hypothetical protein
MQLLSLTPPAFSFSIRHSCESRDLGQGKVHLLDPYKNVKKIVQLKKIVIPAKAGIQEFQ